MCHVESKLVQSPRHDCDALHPGSQFEHQRYNLELDSEVPEDLVLSGRIFIEASAAAMGTSPAPQIRSR